jgi:hypothetical protein
MDRATVHTTGVFVLPIPGRNRISLQCNDSTPYALLLQLAKQRSLEEVKALMKPTLGMEEAVAWVKKQVRGGGVGAGM